MATTPTPKFSQMQGSKLVSKPMGSIENVGGRMQSRMRAYRDLKHGLSTKMSQTKARGLALDMVVGAHERGSTRDKVKVMEELAAEGKLNSRFKNGTSYQLRKAVNSYEKAVDAYAPKEKSVVKKVEADEDPNVKRAKLRQAALQNKMRADHEANTSMRASRGTGISGLVGGRDENVTTSIPRVSPPVKKSEEGPPIMQLD